MSLGPNNHPCNDAASRAAPRKAETAACRLCGKGPISSRAGSKTNMKGTMKPAAPIFTAAQPDLYSSDFASPAAAKTASATGGVMAERMAK